MREVHVYDDARQPVWRQTLLPGEVAAFTVDARTGRHVTERGLRPAVHWLRTCSVFPSLEDAVAHAEKHVREYPDVAIRIYDADAPESSPIHVVANDEALAGVPPARAKRLAAWGTFLIAIGIGLFVLEWFSSWLLVLGAIIGSKFLTVGVMRLGEGLNHLWERRKGGGKSLRQSVSTVRRD
ncbi:MAG: hypothetical protein IPF82_19375 [Blastocatellia bacterium]|nr:hypothetical protein [Blastocatellia bacterium]